MKIIIDKLDFIKFKNFSMKDNIKRIRRQAQPGENICRSISDKGLLTKIYNEILKHNRKTMQF
jgi:hypothetical protein